MICQYCDATMEKIESTNTIIRKKGWEYSACPHCGSTFTKGDAAKEQIIEWQPPFSCNKRPFWEEITKKAESQGTDLLPIWAAYAVRHSDDRVFVYQNRPVMYRKGESTYWSTSYGKYALVLKSSGLYDFEVMPRNNIVELGLEEDIVPNWCLWIMRDVDNKVWGFTQNPLETEEPIKRILFRRKNKKWDFLPRKLPLPIGRQSAEESNHPSFYEETITITELCIFGEKNYEFDLESLVLGDFVFYSDGTVRKQKAMVVEFDKKYMVLRTVRNSKDITIGIAPAEIVAGRYVIERISF